MGKSVPSVVPSLNLLFTDVKLSIVQPLRKTDHVDTMDATFLDSQHKDIFFPVLWAYRHAVESDALYAQHVERMKESLQQVLMSFFSYAGRWIADPVGSDKRKLLCNNEGVPFIEAYLDRDLDSVLDLSVAFQPVPQLQGFGFLGLDVTQFKHHMPPDGLPCMFVQITRFRCGGVALAVTYNHTLTDGFGFLKFLTAWRDSTRSSEAKFEVDNNRIQAEVPSMKALLTDRQNANTASTNGVDSGVSPCKNETWAMKSFEASASAVKTIQQEAKDKHVGDVSTLDCIAAHVWRSLAGLPAFILNGREVSVVSTVEGRSRFYDTPLPNLAANVLSFMPAPKVPINELREMPLAAVASKLRETLLTTRREEWLDLKRFKAFTNNIVAMQVTSWLRFPLYTFNLGWGNPVFCSLNTIMYFDDRLGKVYVIPPLSNSPSSIATVQIFSTPEVLEFLEHNSNFQALFIHPPPSTATSELSPQIYGLGKEEQVYIRT